MRRKRNVAPKPAGCRACKGQPWIDGDGAQRRCSCPSGVWFAQRDCARQLASPYREINALFAGAFERGGR